MWLLECGPDGYGGFNSTDCQSCPVNSGNIRGYNYIVESCGCSEGYTGQNGGPCIGEKVTNTAVYFVISL